MGLLQIQQENGVQSIRFLDSILADIPEAWRGFFSQEADNRLLIARNTTIEIFYNSQYASFLMMIPTHKETATIPVPSVPATIEIYLNVKTERLQRILERSSYVVEIPIIEFSVGIFLKISLDEQHANTAEESFLYT